MNEPCFWAVVAAAGVGHRVAADIPKQYLTIHNQAIIEHALRPFCQHALIKGIVVVTSADDDYWPALNVAHHAKVTRTNGGKERCHSVLNGLQHLQQQAALDDWVLVHDAARPCLRGRDIDQLIHSLRDDSVGGTLAMSVRDTMKRTNAELEVIATVERQHLWHAMTPQMFRLGKLSRALQSAIDNGILVTDETQAIEYAGMTAKVVACEAHNIKVTRAEDMSLAEFYLTQQE